MIPIIYERNERQFMTNGLGRIPDAASIEVVEERNGIYEATIVYPVTGRNFDLIQPGRVVLLTHDESGDAQPFDIVSYERPIEGNVTFHATHVSYRLRWHTVYMENINSLTAAIAALNNEPYSGFDFSADFTSNAYMGASDGIPRSIRQMLGGMEGSILDTYGGEYQWDKWDVNLMKRRGVDRDFMIRYGVNLAEYNEDTDFSSTYNAAEGVWANQDGVVVRGRRVKTGETLFNGREQTAVIDVSDRFDSEPSQDEVDAMVGSILRANQPHVPARTISVNFVRLQDTEEYAQFESLFQCNLCDTIGVIFPRYGMSGTYKIVKTTWDVIAERYVEMELGTLSTSLSEALGITGDTPLQASSSTPVAADYIVSRGSSGNWDYEKWNSGKVVAIGWVTFSSLTFSASGNLYRSVSNSFSIPSGIFTSAPQHGSAWIQGANMAFINATIGGLTTTGGSCEVWKSVSGSASNTAVHMRLVYTP